MIRSILCVCQANISRSAMMEGWLKKLTDGRDLRIESAGTFIDVPVDYLNKGPNPKAVACMKEVDIDISGHRNRPLSAVRLEEFDLIICLTPALAHQVLSLNPRGAVMIANATNGGIPDIHEKGADAYTECSQIMQRVSREIILKYLF